MIKAEPGNYVLSLNEIENGQFILSKHPVIAFHIVPYYDESRYETRPITVIGGPVFVKPTLLTPMVWYMKKTASHVTWRPISSVSLHVMETSSSST
jgi:hypothetical protein